MIWFKHDGRPVVYTYMGGKSIYLLAQLHWGLPLPLLQMQMKAVLAVLLLQVDSQAAWHSPHQPLPVTYLTQLCLSPLQGYLMNQYK